MPLTCMRLPSTPLKATPNSPTNRPFHFVLDTRPFAAGGGPRFHSEVTARGDPVDLVLRGLTRTSYAVEHHLKRSKRH